jgi:hypothetical protein
MKEISIQTDIKVLAEEQYAINLATITCVEHIHRILNYIVTDAQEHKLLSIDKGKALDLIAGECEVYAKTGEAVSKFVSRVMEQMTVGRRLTVCHDPQKSYLYITIKLIQEVERLIISKC